MSSATNSKAPLNVRIVGAGSIGNHLANASRQLKWNVEVCDVDPAALKRMKEEIYPSRYGHWDESIALSESKTMSEKSWDLLCIGTPPDTHIPALKQHLEKSKFRAVQIEKPLCTPDLRALAVLKKELAQSGARGFVGYDHVLGAAAQNVRKEIESGSLGKIEYLDVEFREHWGGIFQAHPWLSGPHDSYLGFWKRGGGAGGEHSHAINLWQYFARVAGQGRVAKVSAQVEFVKGKNNEAYDKSFSLHLETESGFCGRVIQDVVTVPHKKCAEIRGSNGTLVWECTPRPGLDLVTLRKPNHFEEKAFPKSRPQDFIIELAHIRDCLDNKTESPIDIERGIETMLVIEAGYRSGLRGGETVTIDYERGFENYEPLP
jgi:predicted dehydrogenase